MVRYRGAKSMNFLFTNMPFFDEFALSNASQRSNSILYLVSDLLARTPSAQRRDNRRKQLTLP